MSKTGVSELYVDESVATSSSTPCPSPAPVQSASSCTATTVMPSCSMSVLPSRDSSPAILPSVSSATPTPLSSPNMSIIPDCSLSSPVGSSEVPVVSSTSSEVHVLPIMQQPTSALPATVLSVDVITSDENVIDLPVKVDSNGNLCMVSETPAPEDEMESFSPEVVECSSDMALKAIESALIDEMKKKYDEAFQQGKDVNDSLFHTWTMYFEKRTTPAVASSLPSTSSSTLFSLPMQTKKSAAKRKQIGQYFVISSDEAYQEMKKAKEEKELKAEQIKQRKLMRDKIKKEKEDIKKEKALKKSYQS